MSAKPHLFVAALGAEVNTFAPLPIDIGRFKEVALFPAGSVPRDAPPPLIAAPLAPAFVLEQRGKVRVTQGLCAGAQPGGIVARDAYETLRDTLLADLREAGRVDAVVLGLHGAMVAHGYPDCEADLLERVREVLGRSVPLTCLLDPHAHLSTRMLAAADLLLAYKEYPHTDIFECAERLVDLTLRLVRREIRPAVVAVDCRMIGVLHTTRSPGTELIAELRALQEQPGMLDVSVAHGFPWGDVEDCGMRVWATADGDPALAQTAAERISERLREIRDDMRSPLLAPEALADAIAKAPPGLCVVADSADNPGGGAPGDATFLVREMMAGDFGRFAAGIFWDPAAVDICRAAGEGARLQLRVGGKASALSGPPLDLEVEVLGVLDDAQQAFGGALWPCGAAVSIRSGDAILVLSSRRVQCFDTAIFEALGVDLAATRVALVKSSQHFYAAFAPRAAQVLYVEAQGALGDIAALPYRKVERPIWPLDPLPPQRNVFSDQKSFCQSE
jgi:microcystin degradation protein MlrC